MRRWWTILLASGVFAAGFAPGFGAVMHEYGERFWALYYAAAAGNWELAAYELHEQLEAQETGEAVRPKLAPRLKAFEKSHLKALEKAVRAQDFRKFEKAYGKALKACNACHTATGHGYIRYELPQNPPPMLRFDR